jgi:hypothetical protein
VKSTLPVDSQSTMASQFIGLDVRLFLKDSNTLIDGRVLSIDEHTQMITLANGKVFVWKALSRDAPISW